jgi:hypothetical protein
MDLMIYPMKRALHVEKIKNPEIDCPRDQGLKSKLE